MQAFKQVFLKTRPVTFIQRKYASKEKFVFPKVTMDDLPTPEGDFYTHYNAHQKKYNMHLVLGIGTLCATIVFGIGTNMFEFYNELPELAEIECYK